jgi:hypothetical protein
MEVKIGFCVYIIEHLYHPLNVDHPIVVHTGFTAKIKNAKVRIAPPKPRHGPVMHAD